VPLSLNDNVDSISFFTQLKADVPKNSVLINERALGERK
jgi:hypothetical protein